MYGPGSPASAHCSEVANFTTFCADLPICQALSWGMAATTISACLFHGHLCLCISSETVLVYVFQHFILFNSFALVRLLMTADWALCASTL